MTPIKHFVTGLEFADVFISGTSIAIGTDAPAVDARLEISGDANQALIDAKNATTTTLFVSGTKIGMGTRTPILRLDVDGAFRFFSNDTASGHLLSTSNNAIFTIDGDSTNDKGGYAAILLRTEGDNDKSFVMGMLPNTQEFVMTTGTSLLIGEPTIEIEAGQVGIRNNAPEAELDVSGCINATSITGTTITGTMVGGASVRGGDAVFTSVSSTTISGVSEGLGTNVATLNSRLEISGDTNQSLIDAKNAIATTLFVSGSKVGILTRNPILPLDVAGSFRFARSNALLTGYLTSAIGETSLFLDADTTVSDPPSDALIKFRTCSVDNAGFIMGAHNLFDGFVQEFTMTTGQSININEPTFKIKVGKVGIQTNNPQAQLHVSGSPTAALFRVGTGLIHAGNTKVGINMATVNRTLDVSGDLGVSGDIHLMGDIYQNGTAYDNPFTAYHYFSEGEFCNVGDAVVLSGYEIMPACTPYATNCVGIYAGTLGTHAHSMWGTCGKVARVAAVGDNRVFDHSFQVLGGFSITGRDVEIGDLLVTSNLSGYLKKQYVLKDGKETATPDTIIHSYTVGKVLEAPQWQGDIAHEVYGFLLCN